MILSPKIIYSVLGLEDPKIFKEKRITENLFNLTHYSIEGDLYRRTGKTTSLIIEIIALSLEGDKKILVYCRDLYNVRAFIDEIKKNLIKVNEFYPIKFTEKPVKSEIFFEELNSIITVRSNFLDALWSEIRYDIVYSDE